MKKFFSLILTLIMIAGLSTTALASNLSMDTKNDDHTKSVESIYDVVNSSTWQTMERSDRIAACQIPSEQLDNLSTFELVQAVLAFPFFVDIYAFDSIDTGYACLLSECCALQTLVTRPDRADAILSIYENANVVTDISSDYELKQFSHLWNLEMLISQDDFVDIMTENQKDDLVSIAESKYLIKQEIPNMYSVSSSAFFERALESESLGLRAIADTVYTPNGSAVTVYKWTSSDVDFTTAEINSLNSQCATAYPNATRLANPTRKYNCHSYAWYSQSTSNIRWMNNPSKYMTDGSYSEVTKINTSVGDKIVYFTSIDGTNTGINHSAIIVSYTDYPRSKRTFVVKSKWGQLGLYQHSWADGPYMYWEGNQFPSDLEYYHR